MKPGVIDREESFVYSLATRERQPDSRARSSAAVRGPLAWDRVIEVAERERAIPVLFECVKSIDASVLTAEQSGRVQTTTLRNAMSMSNLALRLEELLSVFAAAGIGTVLLKGAALGTTVYRSFNKRPMGDLDILVQPARAREAWELAQTIGWAAETHRTDEAFYDTHHHLPPLIGTQWPGALELHTALLPSHSPFPFPVESVWDAATAATIGAQRTMVPSTMHMTLHACIHFAWSNSMRGAAWRTFRDISWLATRDTFVWKDFVTEAHATRSATCGYWTLRLGRALSGLEVPDSVLAALAPQLAAPVLNRLERFYCALLCPRANWRKPTLRLSQALWSLGIQPKRSGHGDARPWRALTDFGTEEGRAKLHQRDEAFGLRARQLLREITVLIR